MTLDIILIVGGVFIVFLVWYFYQARSVDTTAAVAQDKAQEAQDDEKMLAVDKIPVDKSSVVDKLHNGKF